MSLSARGAALAVLVCLAALAGPVLVSVGGAQSAPTVAVASAEVTRGESATVAVSLERLPNGLSSFSVELALATPGVAAVTDASVREDFTSADVAVGPNDESVTLSASDGDDVVGTGTADVQIGTLTLRGDRVGLTAVEITSRSVTGDAGSDVSVRRQSGTFTVTAPGVVDDAAPRAPIIVLVLCGTGGVLTVGAALARQLRLR